MMMVMIVCILVWFVYVITGSWRDFSQYFALSATYLFHK